MRVKNKYRMSKGLRLSVRKGSSGPWRWNGLSDCKAILASTWGREEVGAVRTERFEDKCPNSEDKNTRWGERSFQIPAQFIKYVQ